MSCGYPGDGSGTIIVLLREREDALTFNWVSLIKELISKQRTGFRETEHFEGQQWQGNMASVPTEDVALVMTSTVTTCNLAWRRMGKIHPTILQLRVSPLLNPLK